MVFCFVWLHFSEHEKLRHTQLAKANNKKISNEIISDLQKEIDACNKEGHLHIQLITNEATAFDGRMAHYGKFSGVQNYIALVGKNLQILKKNVVIMVSVLF